MKKLTGLFAAMALMGSGLALADEGKTHDQKQTQTQSGMTDTLAGNHLTGRVVKSERKMIWVEHAGAIVPLKIDKNTQFSDKSLQRASDLKEGDEIRASFEVRKTENIATRIGMNSELGQGGSGSDVRMPDKGMDPGFQDPLDILPPSPMPPANDGLGGSGEPGSDMNPGHKTRGDY